MNLKAVATFLKLLVIIAIIGFMGMKFFSTGHMHFEDKVSSGLSIPEDSKDINFFRTISNKEYVDFRTDPDSFKQWVLKETGLKEVSYKTSSDPFLFYSKSSDKLLKKADVEHLSFESGKKVYIYDEADKRAYFFDSEIIRLHK